MTMHSQAIWKAESFAKRCTIFQSGCALLNTFCSIGFIYIDFSQFISLCNC